MNSQSNEPPNPAAPEKPPDRDKLPMSEHAAPIDVPVFNCLVYVSKDADGGVKARVANLAGLSRTAGSQREALGKIISAFKQRITELLEAQEPIDWIDPPDQAAPGEQPRWIPVHLYWREEYNFPIPVIPAQAGNQRAKVKPSP